MTARQLPLERLGIRPCAALPECQRYTLIRELFAIKRKVKGESVSARRMHRRAGLGVPA